MARDPVAGPESGPEPPFPIQLNGRIIKGFGRGSKELGIPTANIPITGLDVGGHTDIESGIYYGYASLLTNTATHEPPTRSENDIVVYAMVMSIGWNPYYKNEVRSVEVHLIHKFEEDFYDAPMNLSILGFIRLEKDYDSMEALVTDIKTDIEVAGRSLKRPAYVPYANDEYLMNFNWVREMDGSSL